MSQIEIPEDLRGRVEVQTDGPDQPTRWLDLDGLYQELRDRPEMTAKITDWGLTLASTNEQDVLEQEHYLCFSNAATEYCDRERGEDGRLHVSWSFY